MQRAYLVLMVAGCGFRSPGGSPDLPVPDGGVPDMRSFGATELRAGALVDMTVDGPRSSLTPNAYTYGGLVAHGLRDAKLWARGDTAWTDLAGVTATGAGLWCGEHIVDKARLDYLGVTGTSKMTLWLEGEVWLDGKSTDMFHVNGDDVAFVEIAAPGSMAYLPVAENATAPVPAQVAMNGAGWYPIRVGFSNEGGAYDFLFTRSVSGSDVAWTRDRLRARAGELGGMLRTVFGQQILAGGLTLSASQIAPQVPHFEENDLLHTSLQSPPQGAPADDDDWSARYLGQVYITKPGTYTLQIDSDDGNRARLGDRRGAQHWRRDDGVGTNDATTRVSAELVVGWNDLIVDYNQFFGGSNLRVRIQGPDFPSLIEIPRDQLRPVEPADDRLALGVDEADHPVPDNGGMNNPGIATMTVTGYSGDAVGVETVDSIELTYEVSSPHWDQIKVDLESPSSLGTRVMIRDHDNGPNPPGTDDRIVQFTIPAGTTSGVGALLGGTANGDWKLRVYDDVNMGGGSTLKSARLTLHTKGGPDKLARMASWTSQIIDAQTPVFAIDRVTWNERTPAGAKVAVHVRTCQQSDCSGADWPDPIARGAAFNVPRARYLQLRVDMTSNGTLEPELGGLAIVFRRDP